MRVRIRSASVPPPRSSAAMAFRTEGIAPSRRIVFAVSDRASESAAAWRWAACNLLEPARDQLTLLHIYTSGIAALVRARASARTCSACAAASQDSGCASFAARAHRRPRRS